MAHTEFLPYCCGLRCCAVGESKSKRRRRVTTASIRVSCRCRCLGNSELMNRTCTYSCVVIWLLSGCLAPYSGLRDVLVLLVCAASGLWPRSFGVAE